MKLTTGILAIAMMVGGSSALKAEAQNPDAIDNARKTVKTLQQQQAAKPTPGAPAPSVVGASSGRPRASEAIVRGPAIPSTCSRRERW